MAEVAASMCRARAAGWRRERVPRWFLLPAALAVLGFTVIWNGN